MSVKELNGCEMSIKPPSKKRGIQLLLSELGGKYYEKKLLFLAIFFFRIAVISLSFESLNQKILS